MAEYLAIDLHLGPELDLVQKIHVRFQGKEGVPGGLAPGGVQADLVHQAIDTVAEQDHVKAIAQMAVEVHPVANDRGFEGE